MKQLLVMLFPILLYANLSYVSDHNKELGILESFDIDASFLYDPAMDDIRIKKSSTSENKYFFKAIDNAYMFMPTIKKILAKNNIPKEFIYLPMVESSYSLEALSDKSAAGLWQFIPKTAKYYNLKIDRFIDERSDIVKSTQAASRYLRKLHARFGKWYLAAIAYNCGPTRLTKGIKEANSDSLSILLDDKYSYIPKESKRYIRKIVAFTLIGNDEKLLLQNKQVHFLNIGNTYSLSIVKLPSGESLQRVSKILNIPFKELQNLNRHLKYSIIPPYFERYNIYIPHEKLPLFKQKYFQNTVVDRYKIHTVQDGENIFFISKKYGIDYKKIINLNRLTNLELRLNQKLFIPLVDKLQNLKRISKI